MEQDATWAKTIDNKKGPNFSGPFLQIRVVPDI